MGLPTGTPKLQQPEVVESCVLTMEDTHAWLELRSVPVKLSVISHQIGRSAILACNGCYIRERQLRIVSECLLNSLGSLGNWPGYYELKYFKLFTTFRRETSPRFLGVVIFAKLYGCLDNP